MRIRMMFAALAMFVGVAGVAYAGGTPWFDRDNPGGKGDYEDMVNLMKLECRIKGTTVPVLEGAPGAGYHNSLGKGCWCVNAENGNSCRDLEARWTWSGGSTPWFDRDDPGGKGDFEDLVNLMKVSCRQRGTNAAITNGNPAGWHLTLETGCWCVNAENGNKCTDGEVQWTWP